MDLLPKTEVQVHKAVTAALYKSALSHYREPCLAFILGSKECFTKPRFDFALIGALLGSMRLLNIERGISDLGQNIEVARSLAKDFNREVVAVGIVWDSIFVENKHGKFGMQVDFAQRENISYLLKATITGWDSIWGLSIYFVNRFPHNELAYKMLYEKPKTALDNPRRIKSQWNKVLDNGETNFLDGVM